MPENFDCRIEKLEQVRLRPIVASQVIHLRKQLHKKRKDEFNELQRERGERRAWAEPHDETKAPANKVTDAKIEGGEPTREREAKPFLVVVNMHNRKMLQHEIWKQKFEYLYKQIMVEGDQTPEVPNPAVASSNSVSANANSGDGRRHSFHMAPSLQAGRPGSRPGSRPASRPSGTARSASRQEAKDMVRSQEPTDAPMPSFSETAQPVTAEAPSPPEDGRVTVRPCSRPSSQFAFSGWQHVPHLTASRPSSQQSSRLSRNASSSNPRQHSLTRSSGTRSAGGLLNSRLEVHPGGREDAGPFIPHILRPSPSTPLPMPQELLGVRENYYCSDEQFMHEDILHTSNPQLFPLRAWPIKFFPLHNLPVPNLSSVAAC